MWITRILAALVSMLFMITVQATAQSAYTVTDLERSRQRGSIAGGKSSATTTGTRSFGHEAKECGILDYFQGVHLALPLTSTMLARLLAPRMASVQSFLGILTLFRMKNVTILPSLFSGRPGKACRA